jgi:hypothetical protein
MKAILVNVYQCGHCRRLFGDGSTETNFSAAEKCCSKPVRDGCGQWIAPQKYAIGQPVTLEGCGEEIFTIGSCAHGEWGPGWIYEAVNRDGQATGMFPESCVAAAETSQ